MVAGGARYFELKEFIDREPERDQRGSSSYPSHHCSFVRCSGARYGENRGVIQFWPRALNPVYHGAALLFVVPNVNVNFL